MDNAAIERIAATLATDFDCSGAKHECWFAGKAIGVTANQEGFVSLSEVFLRAAVLPNPDEGDRPAIMELPEFNDQVDVRSSLKFIAFLQRKEIWPESGGQLNSTRPALGCRIATFGCALVGAFFALMFIICAIIGSIEILSDFTGI